MTGFGDVNVGDKVRAMKLKIIVAIVLAAMFTLAGCTVQDGSASSTYDVDNSTMTFKLKDGRTVLCIYYRGLSCDWANAK